MSIKYFSQNQSERSHILSDIGSLSDYAAEQISMKQVACVSEIEIQDFLCR